MNAPGVLAVMDRAERLDREWGDHDLANDLREARATVAELIEAATLILSFNPAHCDTDEEKRLRAALDRADGAS